MEKPESKFVTVTGWVLRDLPGGKAVLFLWDRRLHNFETEVLPKSQIEIEKTDFFERVTMPRWLAKQKGFLMNDANTTQDPPRRRVTHELKTWPEFFEATRGGRKKFELRRADREFQVGDELLLKEWNPNQNPMGKAKGYTGRELLVRVDYIMEAEVVDKLMGLRPPNETEYACVIMSISLIP